MEIITGDERRRRWRSEDKLRIVAEAARSGACFAEVARQHDVSRALLWTWRRQFREGMRRCMNGFALQVHAALGRDPHAGDLYVFRGKRGNLIKMPWHDGLGMSLYAKRLERGRFVWPSPADGVVPVTAAQLGYILEGIGWRQPQRTWRPEMAG